MQTVVETPSYIRAAKNAGMSADEMRAAVDLLARDPAGGVLIIGTRGFRKVRLAGKGHGKSGGYRLISYFAGAALPVVLITVFAKTDRANLSAAERTALAAAEPAILVGLRTLR